jgi:hypothetical protein
MLGKIKKIKFSVAFMKKYSINTILKWLQLQLDTELLDLKIFKTKCIMLFKMVNFQSF